MVTPRVFLDTSVLFAAMLSPTGGSRLILKVAEAGVVTAVVGSRVLAEIDAVMARKAPHARTFVALLLDSAAVEVASPAGPESSEEAVRLIAYAPDAAVLVEAIGSGIDFFVSLDRTHFVGNRTLDALRFRVDTPGECLAWLRGRLEP